MTPRDYLARGWALVPIAAGRKGPTVKDWQLRTFAASDFPAGSNVGVILGPRSGETVDIDLDCAEALALADLYLPPTAAIFGRASKLRSHRLYVAPGAAYEFFGDPLIKEKARSSNCGGGAATESASIRPSFRHRCTSAARRSNGMAMSSRRRATTPVSCAGGAPSWRWRACWSAMSPKPQPSTPGLIFHTSCGKPTRHSGVPLGTGWGERLRTSTMHHQGLGAGSPARRSISHRS